MSENFLTVFEQRVHRLRKKLKDELEKGKKQRSKDIIKRTIHEIRNWERTVQKNRQKPPNCPHCGKALINQ